METAKLYGRWLGMWNGDLSLARDVVSPDCVLHEPGVPANVADDRDGIARVTDYVKQSRAPFQRVVFSLEVGPIEEGDKVAARWTARGAYAGGLPVEDTAPGTIVEFSGVDVCRLADGKIAEYWPTADLQHLTKPIGATTTVEPRPLASST